MDLNKKQWQIQERPPCTPFLDQTEAQRAKKYIIETSPHLTSESGWLPPPPPPSLIWRSGSTTETGQGVTTTVKTNTAEFTQKRHSGSKTWEEGMCVIRSYCKWFLTKILILPCIFEKMHKTDWTENLAVYRTWPLIHPPPSGSTANILVALLPLSFMLAATPETRPPPPQHTITTSGFGISSNISTPALAIE